MDRQHFSSIKSQSKKKTGEQPAPSKASKASGDVLVALESAKGLVDQFGADKVKK